MEPVKASRRPSLSRQDWIDAATSILVASSVDQVRIDTLCKKLNVSKGSFYWHFKNRDDLVSAILEKWRLDAIEGLDTDIDYGVHGPVESLKMLLRLPLSSKVSQQAADMEIAIIGWSRRSPAAQAAVGEINKLRMAKARQILMEIGVPEEQVAFRAHQAYAFIRYIAQRSDLSESDRLDLAERLSEQLMAH